MFAFLWWLGIYGTLCGQHDFEYSKFTNISYVQTTGGERDSLQMLNLVVPVTEKSAPLLLWIGGGAWSYVDRHMEMDFAKQMAAQGIAVASVGHRLSPATWKDPAMDKGVKHPKHIEDVAAAFAWLLKHAEAYGYDPKRIFVGGYSSGAHLSALLTLDDQYLGKHGCTLGDVQGLVAISGTYDIQDYYQAFLNSASNSHLAELHVQAVFGKTSEDFKMASPVQYLDNLSAPILLISDGDVNGYTELFENRLNSSDFDDFRCVYFSEMSHAELWRDLSYSKDSQARELVVNLIKSSSL